MKLGFGESPELSPVSERNLLADHGLLLMAKSHDHVDVATQCARAQCSLAKIFACMKLNCLDA